VTTALYLIALLGIGVLTPMLVRLRLYLGGRPAGVGTILTDGFLLAQLVLLAAFAFIVARLAGWEPSRPTLLRTWTALLVLLALKPWVTVYRLLLWEFPQYRPGALWRRWRARRTAT
jgi:hypothetical protein